MNAAIDDANCASPRRPSELQKIRIRWRLLRGIQKKIHVLRIYVKKRAFYEEEEKKTGGCDGGERRRDMMTKQATQRGGCDGVDVVIRGRVEVRRSDGGGFLLVDAS
ncbi:hypothetical protein U1Q18_050353 [Sarracenia purpurea var. burkii]